MNFKKITISAIGVILFVSALTSCFPLYTLRGYHCDFTGSKKTWTEWPFGLKTRFRYETSPLEDYINSKHPDEIEHKWVSYQGTGKNLLGIVVIRAHGTPNSLLMLSEMLSDWIQNSHDHEVMELYQTLLSGDSERIRSRVDLLHDEWIELMKTEQIQSR